MHCTQCMYNIYTYEAEERGLTWVKGEDQTCKRVHFFWPQWAVSGVLTCVARHIVRLQERERVRHGMGLLMLLTRSGHMGSWALPP